MDCLKARMTYMENEGRRSWALGQGARERAGVFVMHFILFTGAEITQNVSCFCFCFGIWNMRERKRRDGRVIDRRIRAWFSFDMYFFCFYH